MAGGLHNFSRKITSTHVKDPGRLSCADNSGFWGLLYPDLPGPRPYRWWFEASPWRHLFYLEDLRNISYWLHTVYIYSLTYGKCIHASFIYTIIWINIHIHFASPCYDVIILHQFSPNLWHKASWGNKAQRAAAEHVWLGSNSFMVNNRACDVFKDKDVFFTMGADDSGRKGRPNNMDRDPFCKLSRCSWDWKIFVYTKRSSQHCISLYYIVVLSWDLNFNTCFAQLVAVALPTNQPPTAFEVVALHVGHCADRQLWTASEAKEFGTKDLGCLGTCNLDEMMRWYPTPCNLT